MFPIKVWNEIKVIRDIRYFDIHHQQSPCAKPYAERRRPRRGKVFPQFWGNTRETIIKEKHINHVKPKVTLIKVITIKQTQKTMFHYNNMIHYIVFS